MVAAPASSTARAELSSSALVPRTCPVCGSSRTDRIFAEASFTPDALDGFAFASRKVPEYMHYRIVACVGCDVLYSSPTPTPEFLATAYREAEFDASDESRLAGETYGRFLDKIARRFPDRKGALDIGTGDGAFLQQLIDHGFTDVAGVEPSAAPIALAPTNIRPLIRQGLFRASDFADAKFRLITCFQTMEHVDDPLGLCRDAYGLLRPGGALFLVCHNHRAVSARLMGLKSPIFDIEHLQLFSPKSIRKTLERAGFDDIEVHTVVNRYPLHYWAKLAPLPGPIKTPLLKRLKRGILGRTLLSVPVGNMAAIGYKRG
ncbi:MAG TPA: class I SAM-dependent methyltransferase [Polyangiaceae bacterium]|nr:class I SAM-dependent methyltransferase [Polyangiaceae bacterium]